MCRQYLLGSLDNYNRTPNGWMWDLQLKKNVMKTFCKKLNSLNKQSNSFPLNFLNSQLKHKRVCLLPTRQVVMWTLHYIALVMNRTKSEVREHSSMAPSL